MEHLKFSTWTNCSIWTVFAVILFLWSAIKATPNQCPHEANDTISGYAIGNYCVTLLRKSGSHVSAAEFTEDCLKNFKAGRPFGIYTRKEEKWTDWAPLTIFNPFKVLIENVEKLNNTCKVTIASHEYGIHKAEYVYKFTYQAKGEGDYEIINKQVERASKAIEGLDIENLLLSQFGNYTPNALKKGDEFCLNTIVKDASSDHKLLLYKCQTKMSDNDWTTLLCHHEKYTNCKFVKNDSLKYARENNLCYKNVEYKIINAAEPPYGRPCGDIVKEGHRSIIVQCNFTLMECLNNGTKRYSRNRSLYCHCPPEFYGEICQHVATLCEPCELENCTFKDCNCENDKYNKRNCGRAVGDAKWIAAKRGRMAKKMGIIAGTLIFLTLIVVGVYATFKKTRAKIKKPRNQTVALKTKSTEPSPPMAVTKSQATEISQRSCQTNTNISISSV